VRKNKKKHRKKNVLAFTLERLKTLKSLKAISIIKMIPDDTDLLSSQNFCQRRKSVQIGGIPDAKSFKYNQFSISNFLSKEIYFNNLIVYYDLLYIIISYCKFKLFVYNDYRRSKILWMLTYLVV